MPSLAISAVSTASAHAKRAGADAEDGQVGEDEQDALPSFALGLEHLEALVAPHLHAAFLAPRQLSMLVRQCLQILRIAPFADDESMEADELRAEQLEMALATLAESRGGIECWGLGRSECRPREVRIHLQRVANTPPGGAQPASAARASGKGASATPAEPLPAGQEEANAAAAVAIDPSELQHRRLESELAREESEGLFSYLQLVSSVFSTFREDVLVELAARMTILRFDAGQVIVEKGDLSAWFGVVLSGGQSGNPMSPNEPQ